MSRTRSRIRTLGLLLSVTLLICAGARHFEPGKHVSKATTTAQEPRTVRFELMQSMHMAVQVKLNGVGPFRLIFDLGSPVVLVSGRAAAEAGLISEVAARRPAFFGMRGQASVGKLEIDELVADDIPVVIMDHPSIKVAAAMLGPIDGILGYPFFARYEFTIDYQKGIMTFSPGDYVPQDVMKKMMNQVFRSPEREYVVAPAGLWGLKLETKSDDRNRGVTVSHVWQATPAADAGLLVNDRLLSVDGRWTDSVVDAVDAASFVQPGQTAEVVIRRGNKQSKLKLQPRLGI